MLLYINFPSWLKPEVLGFLNLPEGHPLNVIRWYSLSYIIAISISYFLAQYILKNQDFPSLSKKKIDDFYTWGIIGLVLGARIGSCLIYDFKHYSTHPLEILIPFRNGQFTGFAGMSYHGGAIGLIIVSIIYTKIYKINFRELCDALFPTIPLGYTFGRLGNFSNQELYGRVTSSPLSIFFPNAEKVPVKLDYVQKVITELGWKINEVTFEVTDRLGKIIPDAIEHKKFASGTHMMINLPRHPSQLYEGFFEGIVLFLLIWFIARRWSPFKGFMAPVYLAGYSIARFMIEFLRQPDSQFANPEAGKFVGFILGGLSMGQILSIIMFFGAIGLGFYFYYLSKKDIPTPVVTDRKVKKAK